MRLIDADALNLLLDANQLLNPKLSVYDVPKIIEGMPTIDRPKGEWIRKVVNFPPCYDGILVNECSECKEDFVYHNSDTNFCPNCGAEMEVN